MAQAMVNFRMDEELKKKMEQTCKSMGLTMTAAFTLFATKVTRDQRIPFEIESDLGAEEARFQRLTEAYEQLKAGKGTEHDLIEVE
ncbi:MAG: type II toxin-antitoxin system RelB/DinJ family antitoxin [Bacillota bacterium]